MPVLLIVVLVAAAYPAFQSWVQKAGVLSAVEAAAPVRERVAEFVAQQNAWPTTLIDIGYPTEALRGRDGQFTIRVYENGIVAAEVGMDPTGEARFLVFEPQIEAGQLQWRCYGKNIESEYLPADCQ